MQTRKRDTKGLTKGSNSSLTSLEEQFADLPQTKDVLSEYGSHSENQNDDEDYEPLDEKKQESKNDHSNQKNDQHQVLYEELKSLTQNYTLTYTNIKDMEELRKPPLNSMTISEIKNRIRVARQKLQRHNKEREHQNLNTNSTSILAKRTVAQSGLLTNDNHTLKKLQTNINKSPSFQDLSLALFLINDFQSLEKESQKRILQVVDQYLKQDSQLLEESLKQQVKSLSKEAKLFYEMKDQVRLNNLLNKVSPVAAILLNIEISLVNSNIMEEGNTLSQTLLPYINKVTDYAFLTLKTHFISQRFLNSLSRHLVDIKGEVQIGFMLFAIKIDPRKLIDIIQFKNNKAILNETLIHLLYPKDAAERVATYPQKFLWPELFSFFEGKTDIMISDCVQILSKMEIISDPGNSMNKLIDTFAQRRLFVDLLLQAQSIKLGINALIYTLENLAPLSFETITSCLKEDSSKWEALSLQSSNKETSSRQQLSMHQVQEIYNQYVNGCGQQVSFDEMIQISKTISEEVKDYRHCLYQSAIAAAIVSQESQFLIVISPTGSGKTWIQGLIAKYYCQQKQNVAIIEPNNELRLQTANKIGLIDFGISTATINQFYQYGTEEAVVILDEFDALIDEQPYSIYNNTVNGLWELKNKKVIAFSATSSMAHE